MSIEAQIASFEGGRLRLLEAGKAGREAVLALPLSRLLVKMVRVPTDGGDPIEFSVPLLKAISPFPDDPLTVSCELVREDERGKVVIAAALPESATDDIGEALDAARLNVVRIDILVLGQLRSVWNALGEAVGRRMVLVRSVDCLSLVVLDGDQPSALRAITDLSDLRREVLLSLLEAEDFGGVRKLEEIVIVEPEASDERDVKDAGDGSVQPLPSAAAIDREVLSAFAPVRTVQVGSDTALMGVAERSEDPGALDALPDSWREVLEESRFKAKLTRHLIVAGSLWLLIMGVLFGVPVAYGFMTDHQKALSKQQARQYKAVKEMKAKVVLIQKYSDHARGALEIMKAVSDRLPGDVTLSSWDYKREDGVRVKGDADTAEATYAFKDAMDALAGGEGEDAEPIFGSVDLTGPNASKNKFAFSLDCQYQKEDAE